MKHVGSALFVVMLVIFLISCSWFERLGPVGLLQLLAFIASGTYVGLWLYANWDIVSGRCGE